MIQRNPEIKCSCDEPLKFKQHLHWGTFNDYVKCRTKVYSKLINIVDISNKINKLAYVNLKNHLKKPDSRRQTFDCIY